MSGTHGKDTGAGGQAGGRGIPEGGDAGQMDVREVLSRLGTDDAVGRLEARLDEVERSVAALRDRQVRADEARDGSLAVMRGRLDDAFGAVRDTTRRQQAQADEVRDGLACVTDALERTRALQDQVGRLAERVSRSLAEFEAAVAGAWPRDAAEDLAAEVAALRERLDATGGEAQGAARPAVAPLGGVTAS